MLAGSRRRAQGKFMPLNPPPDKDNLNLYITSRANDPDFWHWIWQILPNPDPVIQKLGRPREDIYREIFYDSHVMAQLQVIRAGLLSYEWRVKPASNRRIDKKIARFCEDVVFGEIEPYSWEQFAWQTLEAIFYGFRVHEIVYRWDGQYIVPERIIDVPERLLVFGLSELDTEIRIRTQRNSIEGESMPPHKFISTIHMPNRENPYGVAIFSSCYWPYFFKRTAGMRGLAKYCERHGSPWLIGKYPTGMSETEQESLHSALEKMADSGVATMPNENLIEIIESDVTNLPQSELIKICNAELSKALSCVTLTTELDGQGSFAAAKVQHGREQDVHKTDRGIVCNAFNTLYRYLTELNFGFDVSPPQHEFYEETGIRSEWVDALNIARHYYPIPLEFASERLQFPLPPDLDKSMVLPGYEGTLDQQDQDNDVTPPSFAAAGNKEDTQQIRRLGQRAADDFTSQFPDEIEKMLRDAKTYEEMQSNLPLLLKKKVI